MTNPLQITEKLYECRDTAKTLLRDKYHDRMAEYACVIRGVAAARRVGLLEAGIEVGGAAGGGFSTLLVLAATVEIIEPSTPAVVECAT